jgi:peptidoglycan/LPS O-acetylase OafA/YrhL
MDQPAPCPQHSHAGPSGGGGKPDTCPRGVLSHASFLGQRRFRSLNGLRCLAIVEVIGHHASGRRTGPLALGIGVDLSFAISGFLITTLLVREFRKTGRINVRRFYARRALRIFPLYFTVLGIYVVLVLLTRRGTAPGTAFIHNLPAFATFTSNWFVALGDSASNVFYFAWSLATQEQFYLLWAPALLLCLAPGRWWRAGAVMVGLIVVDQIAWHAASGNGLLLTILRSIGTPICLGAIWSLVLHSPTGYSVARQLIGHRATAPALLAVLALSLVVLAPYGILEFLLAALVAACCIREDNLAAGLLTAGPLDFVGEISYGMYLMHMLAIDAVRPILGARFGVAVFLAGTAVTIALAAASYRWFETPILRRRDRVRRAEAQAVPVVAGEAPTPA